MEWKPLWYKGLDLSEKYLVSENGQIYSLKTNRILKQTLNKSTGYYGICISIGGRKEKKLLKPHIAVAENFIPGNHEGLVVNHKDGNKQNNKVENLEWITPSKNCYHAIEHGLIKGTSKIRCINQSGL